VEVGAHKLRFLRSFGVGIDVYQGRKPSARVQVDVLFTDESSWGAAEMHLTGPAGRNIGQRKLAAKAGLKLNEKGLWRGDERLPCSRDEREIYDHMGWTWREPKNRG
jgi:DNA polymerase (family 10)